MNGIATRTEVYVGFYGDGTSHWQVDPPLDGFEFILVCDRTQLSSWPTFDEEPNWAAMGVEVETRVPHAVEVFASDAAGGVPGGSMTSLRNLISLRRHSEGVDMADTLERLGYVEATA